MMESSKEDQDDNDGHGQTQQQRKYKHHPSLTVLDLGFNNIGDEGCTSLATLAVARNPALSTLYISGNAVREAGALALAEVIAGGTGLTSLHLTANRIGPKRRQGDNEIHCGIRRHHADGASGQGESNGAGGGEEEEETVDERGGMKKEARAAAQY